MAKKTSGSLDTNVLLRLLLNDVPEQTILVESLLSKGVQFEIADATIFELVFVLERVYGMERELVCENISAIIGNPKFNSNRALFKDALRLYESESKLSIIDCALLVYARLQKALPLFTFDKELQKKSMCDAQKPA